MSEFKIEGINSLADLLLEKVPGGIRFNIMANIPRGEDRRLALQLDEPRIKNLIDQLQSWIDSGEFINVEPLRYYAAVWKTNSTASGWNSRVFQTRGRLKALHLCRQTFMSPSEELLYLWELKAEDEIHA
jgi:hypothetical protein